MAFADGFYPSLKDARTQRALSNYGTDPDEAVRNYMAVDAPAAIGLQQYLAQQRATQAHTAQEQAAENRKRAYGAITGATDMLRSVRDKGGDVGAAYDQLDQGGILDTLGMSPQEKAHYRAAITANPGLIDVIGQRAAEGIVVAPGSQLMDKGTGRVLGSTPAVPKPLVVRRGDGGSDVIYPNAPGSAPGAAPAAPGGVSGPLTMETARPLFKAQESSGNYTAVNKDTGALGAYQVMPQTGAVLAKQLGLGWRPDMMTRDDPASKRYQDAIGGAAISEALNASGGDPRTAFMYYYGGPDRSKWGPKTRQYADEMQARAGRGNAPSAAPQSGAVYSTPGAPPKAEDAPSGYRYKPDGSLEFIPGGPGDPAVKGNSTGTPLTKTQVGAATQKLITLKAIANQLDRVQRAYDNAKKSGYVGPGWGNVPFSGSFNDESGALDKSLSQVAPLVTSLTRVPGIGSMSDYESKLANMGLPHRNDNEGAFREGMTGFRELLDATITGYQEMLGQSGGAAPRGGSAAPASGGGDAPGSSQQNPIPIRSAQDAIKNSGKWVKTPDGRIGRAK